MPLNPQSSVKGGVVEEFNFLKYDLIKKTQEFLELFWQKWLHSVLAASSLG